MKRLLCVMLTVLLLCSLLFGCGSKAADGAFKGEADPESMMNGSVTEEAFTGSVTDSSLADRGSGSTQSSEANPNQKLVRKLWLTTETEDMDSLLNGVAQQITQLGGYIESRQVNNGSAYSSRRYRSADLTIRIPAENLDSFVQHVSENSNITNNRETAEDITLSYVATESRVKALETEETRLLELLAGAENMSDLLQIEDRLTDVRTELEKVRSTLRVYDNQVNYGTVYLSVSEVKEYTVTEEPETVWQRIGAGFVESLKDLGEFFTELFVFLVVGLPYFVLIGIVLTAVLLLLKRRKKKKAQKNETQ